MARLPRVTSREVVRVLAKQGYVLDRQKGAHQVYISAAGGRVTVPVHAGKTLKPKTLKSILKDANLSTDRFSELLKE